MLQGCMLCDWACAFLEEYLTLNTVIVTCIKYYNNRPMGRSKQVGGQGSQNTTGGGDLVAVLEKVWVASGPLCTGDGASLELRCYCSWPSYSSSCVGKAEAKILFQANAAYRPHQPPPTPHPGAPSLSQKPKKPHKQKPKWYLGLWCRERRVIFDVRMWVNERSNLACPSDVIRTS